MKFNGYPLKDELGEGLHIYERNTGLSAHLLIESLVEQYLIKTGILGSDDEENVDFPFPITPEITPSNFRVETTRNRSKISLGELNFGSCKSDGVDERIKQLCQFSYNELEELSQNNWDNSNGQYYVFLRWKLENPASSLEEYLVQSRIRINYRPNGSWQLRDTAKFCFCSGKDKTELETITNYLCSLSDGELEQLKETLNETNTGRRTVILDKIKG